MTTTSPRHPGFYNRLSMFIGSTVIIGTIVGSILTVVYAGAKSYIDSSREENRAKIDRLNEIFGSNAATACGIFHTPCLSNRTLDIIESAAFYMTTNDAPNGVTVHDISVTFGPDTITGDAFTKHLPPNSCRNHSVIAARGPIKAIIGTFHRCRSASGASNNLHIQP